MTEQEQEQEQLRRAARARASALIQELGKLNPFPGAGQVRRALQAVLDLMP